MRDPTSESTSTPDVVLLLCQAETMVTDCLLEKHAKPYLSGSNYVRKMSDFEEGPWCEIWGELFWSFIEEPEDFFAGNPRLAVVVTSLSGMDLKK